MRSINQKIEWLGCLGSMVLVVLLLILPEGAKGASSGVGFVFKLWIPCCIAYSALSRSPVIKAKALARAAIIALVIAGIAFVWSGSSSYDEDGTQTSGPETEAQYKYKTSFDGRSSTAVKAFFFVFAGAFIGIHAYYYVKQQEEFARLPRNEHDKASDV